MSLPDKQFKEIVTRELLKILVLGRLPNIEEVSKSIKELLENHGQTIFQYIPSLRRSPVNPRLINRQLNSIQFDILLAYDEILDLALDSIKTLSYADLFHKVNNKDLQRLNNILDMILFSFEGADFYFLGAFDDFSDRSKIDAEKSTQDIIDLKEGALVLPFGGSNTKRINVPHLINKSSWPVNVITPADPLEKRMIPGTKFSNMFTDIVNPWGYEVVSNDQSGSAISLIFPITKGEEEKIISRIELIPFSTGPQRVVVEVSTDNVNFKKLEGYEDGILMEDPSKVYALDFIKELVQFIKLTLIRETPDIENSGRFIYRFGLKHFSAWTTGRVKTATYYSKPFDFEDNKDKIRKISMKADMEVPRGTHVDFSIALADEDDNLVTGFIPIKPINNNAKKGSQEIIKFDVVEEHSKKIVGTDQDFSERERFRGQTFWTYNEPILPLPLFGSAQLFRGLDAWARDKRLALKHTQVRDNYISFAKVDTERLYTVTTEVPFFQKDKDNSNRPIVRLTTSRDVYYIPGIHDMTPDFNKSQPRNDITPTYAVYRVEHIAFTPQDFMLVTTDRRRIKLPVDNFIVRGPNAPTVTNANQTKVYTAGRDYIIETEPRGGQPRPTGYIVILSGGDIKIDKNNQIRIVYTIDPDVTYKVTSVSANNITLSNISPKSGDTFKVTYRWVPVPPNDVIKPSVRVKNNISNRSGVKYYVEGVDYIFDQSTAEIQRLPNGAIPDNGSVFVDYLYNNAEESVETFTVWCEVGEEADKIIRLELDPTTNKNKLTVDKEKGERFLMNSQLGLIDLTYATQTPVLPRGWVQFIVRSKNPDANKQMGKNLIDQIIQLRDTSGRKIFRSGGAYFNKIIAFRDPMRQRTLNHLRTSTLATDHSVFAIDTANEDSPSLVLNFKPGSTDEIYPYIPTEDNDVNTLPRKYYETFELKWSSKLDTDKSGNKVVVRCDLGRDDGFDGSITPKVYKYFIRASVR